MYDEISLSHQKGMTFWHLQRSRRACKCQNQWNKPDQKRKEYGYREHKNCVNVISFAVYYKYCFTDYFMWMTKYSSFATLKKVNEGDSGQQ